MTYSTINGGKTIAGGGKGAILAGRCKIIRQLGLVAWRQERSKLGNGIILLK